MAANTWINTWKQYLPRGTADFFCMSFTIGAFPTVIIHGYFFLLPALFPRDSSLYLANLVLMLFLWINVVISYFMAMTVNTCTKQLTQPVVAQEGWVYCPLCQAYAPTRTYHCPVCNICVIRRDHHCFFTGKCVGLQNHRFFLMFVIYALLGCSYGLVLSISYAIQQAGGYDWRIPFSLFLPVLAFSTGQIIVNPIIGFLAASAFAGTVASLVYLILQFKALQKGQTFYEWQRGIFAYDNGLLENIKELLGKNWWICWLFPLLPSPLPTDGSNYAPLPPSYYDTHGPGSSDISANAASDPEGRGQVHRRRVH